MRVLLLLPRIWPEGDSTWIFFSRLALALEEEGAELGIVHGMPPGWGEPPVPARWWQRRYPAPRRRDAPVLAGPFIRLASWLSPWKGGIMQVGHTRRAVAAAVTEWEPDGILCHDFPTLLDAAWRKAPRRTCLWMVEPNPLVPAGGFTRRLRDSLHRPWWEERARAVGVLAATWSGRPARDLAARLGRPVETLFPGIPESGPGGEKKPLVGFFGNLRGRMRNWLASRIAPLADAANSHGLRLAFWGLGPMSRRWVRERVPNALVADDRLPHAEAMAAMASCRLLLGLGASGIQATGKVLDYLATGTPILYFGRATAEDASLVRRLEAGASFSWRRRPEEMAACLAEALAARPAPPPSDLGAAAQARLLLSWFGDLRAGLP